MNAFVEKLACIVCLYIPIYCFSCFCIFAARETKNRQWFLLVRSRTKVKKEKREKRQPKGKQKCVSEEMKVISSSDYSTVSDDEVVQFYMLLPMGWYFQKKQKSLYIAFLIRQNKAYRNIGERNVVCFTILHASVGDTRQNSREVYTYIGITSLKQTEFF